MLRRYSANFMLFSIVLDAVSIAAALSLTGFLHPLINLVAPLPVHADEYGSRRYSLLFPAVWIALNLTLGLYDGRRNYRFFREVSRLVLSMLFAAISLRGLLYYFSDDFVHPIFVTFILVATGFKGTWRVAVRYYWRLQYLRNQELRRVLIIGAGECGQRLKANMPRPPDSNLEVVGFLDDDLDKRTKQKDILGTTQDLEEIVDCFRINILIITLPYTAFALISDIVNRMRMTPVKIWIVPSEHRLALNHCSVEYYSGIPLMDIRAPSISDNQRLIKRVLDLVLSATGILLLAPVMILIAILIKLDSPGPILFRQKRVGENTQPFEMLKFRTMVQNAERLSASVETKDEQGNILHKHRNDPRVTGLGRFLRRYSLDELPQLFNILSGKMSLVGPRPELPYLVEKYRDWQYVRFTIPQGLTGWWQVNGRSDKPMHLNTEDDLYYIQNYSIWLDFKIMFKTVAAIVVGKGAY